MAKCLCLEKREAVRREQLEPLKRRKGGYTLKVAFGVPEVAPGSYLLEERFLKKSREAEGPVVPIVWSFKTQRGLVSGVDYVVAQFCPFCGDRFGPKLPFG